MRERKGTEFEIEFVAVLTIKMSQSFIFVSVYCLSIVLCHSATVYLTQGSPSSRVDIGSGAGQIYTLVLATPQQTTSLTTLDFTISLSTSIFGVDAYIAFDRVPTSSDFDRSSIGNYGSFTQSISFGSRQLVSQVSILVVKRFCTVCNTITVESLTVWIRSNAQSLTLLGSSTEKVDIIWNGPKLQLYTFSFPPISLVHSNLQLDVSLSLSTSGVNLFFGFDRIPTLSSYDLTYTGDLGDISFTSIVPSRYSRCNSSVNILVQASFCQMCSSVTIESVKLTLTSRLVSLVSGQLYNPPDLYENFSDIYLINTPSSISGIKFQEIDIELDVANPANTMSLYIGSSIFVDESDFLFKQDDGESGDLSMTFAVSPLVSYYILVIAVDCEGCSKITYDITVKSRNIRNISLENNFVPLSSSQVSLNQTFSDTVYENYNRIYFLDALDSKIPTNGLQINFAFDMSDLFAPLARISVCLITSETSANELSGYSSERVYTASDCSLFTSEYGDTTLSYGLANSARLWVIVRNLYFNWIGTDLSLDITISQKSIPEVNLDDSVIIGSVYEKTMNFYAVRLNRKSGQLLAKMTMPKVYTYFNELYIRKNDPPSKQRFDQAATNVSAYALIFPSLSSRVVSLAVTEDSEIWYIGVQGTSCGGLCSNAPYNLTVVFAPSTSGESLSESKGISQRKALTLVISGIAVTALGCIFIVVLLIMAWFKKTESFLIRLSAEKESPVSTRKCIIGSCLLIGCMLVTGSTLFYLGYKNLRSYDPQVEITSHKLSSFNIWNLEATFDVGFNLSNENIVAAKTKAFQLSIFYEPSNTSDSFFFGNGTVGGLYVPGESNQNLSIQLHFDIDYFMVPFLLQDLFEGDRKLVIRIVASIDVEVLNIPLLGSFSVVYPLNRTKEIGP